MSSFDKGWARKRHLRTQFLLARDAAALRALQYCNRTQYGGTWTYELVQGATPNQTNVHITEAGYIHPPLYRFRMKRIFGMTRNFDTYLTELKVAAAKWSDLDEPLQGHVIRRNVL